MACERGFTKNHIFKCIVAGRKVAEAIRKRKKSYCSMYVDTLNIKQDDIRAIRYAFLF